MGRAAVPPYRSEILTRPGRGMRLAEFVDLPAGNLHPEWTPFDNGHFQPCVISCNQSNRHFRKFDREEKCHEIEDLRFGLVYCTGAHLERSSSAGKRCRKSARKTGRHCSQCKCLQGAAHGCCTSTSPAGGRRTGKGE